MEFCKPTNYVKDHHTVTEYVYDKLYDYSELKAFMCDIEKAYGILDLISCKKMESGKDTWNKQFQSVDDFLNNFTIEDYNKSNMYYMKSDEENFEFFINDIEKNLVVMKDLDKINIQRNEKEKYYIYEDKYVVRRNIYDEFFKKNDDGSWEFVPGLLDSYYDMGTFVEITKEEAENFDSNRSICEKSDEKIFLGDDIFDKEELFPLRCVLKKNDGTEIPVIWNFKKTHKAALLCLHGFGGDKDSSVIKALMDEMDSEGAGVVTFDWPAHGESTAPDYALTVERCLEDLDAVVKFINQLIKQSNKRICCFATSFGGYLATLYRNSHENAFLYLILRSPALKMADTYRRLTGPEDFERLMQGELIEQGYERKMHLGRDFYDSLTRNDAYDPKPPLPWNIMILQGDKDDIVDPKDIKAYAERCKAEKLRLVIFEGTDHLYKRPGEKERIIGELKEYLDHFLHPEKYDLKEVERKRKEV